MGLKDYLAIARDRREALGTLARWRVAPRLAEGAGYEAGAVAATVERFHPSRIAVRVAEIPEETESSRVLRLVPASGQPFPPFRAGQYVNVFVTVQDVATSRAFSIASPGTEVSGVELLVRRKEGGFVSPFLCDTVQVGDELSVSGPAGELRYDPLRDTRDLLLVGGGSGVAPMVGIAREALARDLSVRIRLLYGARSQRDLPYVGLLRRLAERHPERLALTVVLSEPEEGWDGETGLFDRELLGRLLADGAPAESLTAFVCGPPAMHRLAVPALAELGVPRRRIREEAFGPPDGVTTLPGWPEGVGEEGVFAVTVRQHGDEELRIEAPAGWPLMASLERAGLVLPALCRTGVCATCRTRLLRGEVFVPEGGELRRSDHEAGFIHPCMSYPVSDLVLRLP